MVNNGILIPLTESSLDIISNVSSLLEWKDLEAIPGGATLIKALSLGQSISDRVFLNKVVRFYAQCSDVSFDKRVHFTQKYNDSKVGENLLIMIDSIESFDKAEAIGKIFKEFLLENIDKDQFDRIAYALRNIYSSDLKILLTPLKDIPFIDSSITGNLENLGLLECSYIRIDEGGGDGNIRKQHPSKNGIVVCNSLFASHLNYETVYQDFRTLYELRAR